MYTYLGRRHLIMFICKRICGTWLVKTEDDGFSNVFRRSVKANSSLLKAIDYREIALFLTVFNKYLQ